MLLRDLGVSEDDVSELVNHFQQDDYALIRAAYAEVEDRLQPPSTLGGGCFGVLRGWAMLRREGVPWKSRFGL